MLAQLVIPTAPGVCSGGVLRVEHWSSTHENMGLVQKTEIVLQLPRSFSAKSETMDCGNEVRRLRSRKWGLGRRRKDVTAAEPSCTCARGLQDARPLSSLGFQLEQDRQQRDRRRRCPCWCHLLPAPTLLPVPSDLSPRSQGPGFWARGNWDWLGLEGAGPGSLTGSAEPSRWISKIAVAAGQLLHSAVTSVF